MVTRTLLILFCLIAGTTVLFGQSTPISVKEYTENPWPSGSNYRTLKQSYGDYLKEEKYTVKSRHESSKRDTIIRLFKRKTEIFFYQPYNNGIPFFLGANIFDNKIKLKGNISTGILTSEFFDKVSFPEVNSDTVKITLPKGLFNTTLISRKKKIYQIKIEAQNNQK